MIAILFYGAWIAGAMYSLFLMVRVATISRRTKQPDAAGTGPSAYIVLSILLWTVEAHLSTLALHGSAAEWGRGRLGWNYWDPFTLWWPPEVLAHWPTLSWAQSPNGMAVLLVLALGAAVALSIMRLRNAALPVWIAVLALIPFVNFGLFLFLSVVPARSLDREHRLWTASVLPRDPLGSAVVSCLITALLGIGFSQFGTLFLGSYGWVLFTLVPVVMGFCAAVIYGLSEPRSYWSCVSVALVSVALGGLAILGFAIEGAFCVLLAAPLALPLAAFGGWLGYLVQRRDETAQAPQIAGALLFFLPFIMYGEQRGRSEARQIEVSTSIVIHAPADRVWQSVIHLASVPKPDSVIFHSVAYPIRTTLQGTGIGATRQCVFSTGSIVEPIKVWQPGHELRFAVLAQPPLMRELSPYSDVHPPHLKLEYLRSKEGQFTLSPLPDGATLLTGTSYYESRLWPGAYWQIWTDGIAHTVHRVVLGEIKRQSEN